MNAIATNAGKLTAIAIGAALLVTVVDDATRPRIATERGAGAARALAAELGIPELARSSMPYPRPDDVQLCVAGIGALRVVRGHARGYGGAIDYDVAIDRDGRLRGAGVSSHRETPALARAIVAPGSPYLRTLVGRDARADSFALEQDGGGIDALSGATFTSRALVDGIARTVAAAAPSLPPECTR